MGHPLPPLRLVHAADGLSCILSAVPEGPVLVVPEDLRRALCDEGIPQELLDDEAIARAAGALRAGREVEDMVVARGRAVEHGVDAVLRLDVLRHGLSDPDPDGRLDLRDHGQTESVDRGTRLGVVRFDTPGQDGLTTRGERIPARPGQPLPVRLGENVDVGENGELRAAIDGFALLRDGELGVLRDFHVRGDVDYAVGHVRLDRGDVHVEGNVRPGFIVQTAGSINVRGDVEGATLVAGGDVIVQGVVVEGDGCTLQAGGSVQVSRTTGATLRAGGDVEVRAEAYEARIRCGGVLRVPGRLVGGEALAAGGAEVGVLGGAGHTATRLAVGRDVEALEAARGRAEELRDGLARLRRLAGEGSGREGLQVRIQGLDNELREQEALLAGLEAERGTAVIQVRKALHPGVVVEIDGRARRITEPVGPVTVVRGDDGEPDLGGGAAAA